MMTKISRKRLLDGTVPANKLLLAGTVPVNKLLSTGTLSNVRRCLLAMPVGAGVLSWVLAWRTIERKNETLACTPTPHTKPLRFFNFEHLRREIVFKYL